LNTKMLLQFAVAVLLANIAPGVPAVRSASLVSIDAQALTGTAEPPALLTSRPKLLRQELRFGVTNDEYLPLTATIKITGLPAKEYDCYANGSYRGVYGREALERGIATKLDAGVVSQQGRKLIELYISIIQPAADGMMSNPLDSPYATEFRDAALWARRVSGEDKRSRTEFYTFIESGIAPAPTEMTSVDKLKDPRIGWKGLISDLERFRHVIHESKLISAQKKAKYQGWIMPIAVNVPTASTVVLQNYYSKPVKGTLKVSNAPGAKLLAFSIPPGKSQKFLVAGITADGGMKGLLTGTSGLFTFERIVDTFAENATMLNNRNRAGKTGILEVGR